MGKKGAGTPYRRVPSQKSPGFMGVEWTALQLHFNFLLLDFKLRLEPSQYRIFSALGYIMLNRAFSDPTLCNPVLIWTFCFNKFLAYININTLSFCPTCIVTYCNLQSFYSFLQLQYDLVFSTTVSPIPTHTNWLYTIIGMIMQWVMLMTFITIIPWFIRGAIAVVMIFEIYHISLTRESISTVMEPLKYSSQTFCTKIDTQSDSFGWKALPWFWQRSSFLNLHSISEAINETLLNF